MRKNHFVSSLVIFVSGFVLCAIVDGRQLALLARGTLSNPVVAEVASQSGQKSSTLQKWEYRIVTKFVSSNQVDIDFELNRLGEQGYEICEMTQSASNQGLTLLTIALRRPK
jgi:enoyl reductase-like protein